MPPGIRTRVPHKSRHLPLRNFSSKWVKNETRQIIVRHTAPTPPTTNGTGPGEPLDEEPVLETTLFDRM